MREEGVQESWQKHETAWLGGMASLGDPEALGQLQILCELEITL